MYRNPKKGSATLEVLIALAILVIALTGIISISLGGQVAGLDTSLTNHGLYRMISHFEDNVTAIKTGWHSFSAVLGSDETYAHSSAVRDISPCVKELSAGVTWTTDKSRAQGLGLATLVANVDEAKKLGGDCDPFPPSPHWNAPSSYPISDPIFSGSQATDVDVISEEGKRFALVTTLKNPSPSGNETFWMVDTTNLDTNPLPFSSFATPHDLTAVDAIGNFAFVVGATTTDQKPFQILDISDATITLAAEVSLPNANSEDFEKARSVHYYDSRVFVGTDYMAFGAPGTNHELHIFDVSNPYDPVWEASINVDRNVNDIVVQNGIAYVATGPGGDNTVLKLYDVASTSPAYLSLIGEYAASSAQAGTSVYLHGNYIYLGRERTAGSHHDFLVINVSNPAAPILSDSARLDLNSGTAVEGIAVRGSTAFIVTSDQTSSNGGGPFILFDVSNPNDIVFSPPCTSINWSEKATGLDMSENFAFVSNESNDALQVIYPSLSCTL